MVIFHTYVKLPEGISIGLPILNHINHIKPYYTTKRKVQESAPGLLSSPAVDLCMCARSRGLLHRLPGKRMLRDDKNVPRCWCSSISLSLTSFTKSKICHSSWFAQITAGVLELAVLVRFAVRVND